MSDDIGDIIRQATEAGMEARQTSGHSCARSRCSASLAFSTCRILCAAVPFVKRFGGLRQMPNRKCSYGTCQSIADARVEKPNKTEMLLCMFHARQSVRDALSFGVEYKAFRLNKKESAK